MRKEPRQKKRRLFSHGFKKPLAPAVFCKSISINQSFQFNKWYFTTVSPIISHPSTHRKHLQHFWNFLGWRFGAPSSYVANITPHLEAMKSGLWKGSDNPILSDETDHHGYQPLIKWDLSWIPPHGFKFDTHLFRSNNVYQHLMTWGVSLGFGISSSTRIFQLMIDNFFGKNTCFGKNCLGPNTYPCYPRLYLLVWWLEKKISH